MDSNISELAQKQARRVVYLCGAGLSVPSGIRAYRSGPRAIWSENVMAWGTAQNEVVLPQLTLG